MGVSIDDASAKYAAPASPHKPRPAEALAPPTTLPTQETQRPPPVSTIDTTTIANADAADELPPPDPQTLKAAKLASKRTAETINLYITQSKEAI